MSTVYISIGNSDDRLTQSEWSQFYVAVDATITDWAMEVHGRWLSAPNAPFQNACWCVELSEDISALDVPLEHSPLRHGLSLLAKTYRQDSIAWAECETTVFLPALDCAKGHAFLAALDTEVTE